MSIGLSINIESVIWQAVAPAGTGAAAYLSLTPAHRGTKAGLKLKELLNPQFADRVNEPFGSTGPGQGN